MDIDNSPINWYNLSKTVAHYKDLGFSYVEAPWIIPKEFTHATYNRDGMFSTGHGELVGSAEQSFIYLNSLGMLQPGMYCALTPCFRNEDIIDSLHQHWFMKVELIKTDVVNKEQLSKIVSIACSWFDTMSTDDDIVSILPTNDGYDIMLNNIEVGSYGIRKYNDFEWIYATGLAEPRFTQAINQR